MKTRNMYHKRFAFGRLLVAAGLLLWAGSAVAAGASVVGVRLGAQDGGARIVVDLSGPAAFRVFTLADPYRVVVDLPKADWKVRARTPLPRGGLVAAFRYGQFKPGDLRVVFDVSQPALVRKAFILPPSGGAGHRLAIDLDKVSAAEFSRREKEQRLARAGGQTAGRSGASRSSEKLAPEKPIARPRAPGARRVVVVDAGHGGVDPGTIGARGTREKTITLRLAQELRRQLEATGRYRVVLTRDGDFVLPLRERVAIARRSGGELFLSLHADSIRNHKLRGASVYTLSENASDNEAAALAAKENKADIIAGVDLNGEDADIANILIDLAQRESMNLSARFAAMLVGEFGKDLRLLRRTHRFAGFAVLKAPDVPAVLVELGYLSNRADEALLRKASHRAKIAGAVVRAIKRFFALTDRLSRT